MLVSPPHLPVESASNPRCASQHCPTGSVCPKPNVTSTCAKPKGPGQQRIYSKNRSSHRLPSRESGSSGETQGTGQGGLLLGVSLPSDLWRGRGRNGESIHESASSRKGRPVAAFFPTKLDRCRPGVRLFIIGHVFTRLPLRLRHVAQPVPKKTAKSKSARYAKQSTRDRSMFSP